MSLFVQVKCALHLCASVCRQRKKPGQAQVQEEAAHQNSVPQAHQNSGPQAAGHGQKAGDAPTAVAHIRAQPDARAAQLEQSLKEKDAELNRLKQMLASKQQGALAGGCTGCRAVRACMQAPRAKSAPAVGLFGQRPWKMSAVARGQFASPADRLWAHSRLPAWRLWAACMGF